LQNAWRKKDEIKALRKQSRKFNLKLDRLPQCGKWAHVGGVAAAQLQQNDVYKSSTISSFLYLFNKT